MCCLIHLKESNSAQQRLVFTQTTGQQQGGPWALWTFQNTNWKKKTEVWGQTKMILFASYMVHEDLSKLTPGRPSFIKCHDWEVFAIDSEIHLFYRKFVFMFSLSLLGTVISLKIKFIESNWICWKDFSERICTWQTFEQYWLKHKLNFPIQPRR